MAAMVAGIGILYAGLFGQDVGEYMPFLAVGLIFWNFMAGLINDGCTVFIAAEHTIKQMRMPFTLHVFRQIWRNVIMLGHNLLIYVAIVLIFQISVGWSLLLVVPGLALLLVNGWSAGVVFGIIAARFRDVPPIIGSIVQIAFFLTPIIWRPESLPDRAAFLKLNPFYYLLEIVRQPLLGSVPSLEIWLGALAFTTVGFVTAAVMFYRYRRRIAYWV
jgi:ABC-type polysaccharide/polyol phosphate export permease